MSEVVRTSVLEYLLLRGSSGSAAVASKELVWFQVLTDDWRDRSHDSPTRGLDTRL